MQSVFSVEFHCDFSLTGTHDCLEERHAFSPPGVTPVQTQGGNCHLAASLWWFLGKALLWLTNPSKLELSPQTCLGRSCLWHKDSLKVVSEMPPERCSVFPITTHPCMSPVSKKTLHLPSMFCLKYGRTPPFSKRETPR